ncbi:MAG: hypothetical protein QW244_01670 [Candidatus Pacearchaeota archaeon]
MKTAKKAKRAQTSVFGLILATFILIFLIIIYLLFSVFYKGINEKKNLKITEQLDEKILSYYLLDAMFTELDASTMQKIYDQSKMKYNLSNFAELFYAYYSSKDDEKLIENIINKKLDELELSDYTLQFEIIKIDKIDKREGARVFLPFSNSSVIEINLIKK